MTDLLENTYPAYLESDVVLRNGHTLRLRPVRHEEGGHLIRFYTRLSPVAHSRFFDPRPTMATSPPTFTL